MLQSSSLYPLLTARAPRPLRRPTRTRAADEWSRSSASPKAARVRTLGRAKRRLDLGLALVGNPELIFLDEPTTGFDPGARRAAWETIRNLRSLGTTILLTTHYLDEAEQLADRVAVLRDGEIVREGSPAELTGDGSADRDPLPAERPQVVAHDDPTGRLNGGRARSRRDIEASGAPPTLEEIYLGDRRVRLFVQGSGPGLLSGATASPRSSLLSRSSSS